MYKPVKIEDVVGLVLAHDVTEIWRGEFKGRAFRKGLRIRHSNLCHLQRLGKEHLFVLTLEEGYLHENDAALAMAMAFCGPNVGSEGETREDRLYLTAQMDGLLKVYVEALLEINLLVIQTARVDAEIARAKACKGLLEAKSLRRARTYLVITGNEVFTDLIEYRFESVLREKINRVGSKVVDVAFAPDNFEMIAAEIKKLMAPGVDLILTTGGMSVDPDDVTRQSIQHAGGECYFYGDPVFPGAMPMTEDIDYVSVFGISACGLYHQTTILDLVMPRILAGERMTRRAIAGMGHGGLCLSCEGCRFPQCFFGKST